MFNKGKTNHTIDMLFPIVLLFVFAISALVVMLFAANIYSETVENSNRNNNARTSIIYISEKIHQNDNAGGIRAGKIDGNPALVIDQDIEGAEYRTYVYAYDGELRELFVKADHRARADEGTAIISIKDFNFEKQSDGLFRVNCTDAYGNEASTLIGSRSTNPGGNSGTQG